MRTARLPDLVARSRHRDHQGLCRPARASGVQSFCNDAFPQRRGRKIFGKPFRAPPAMGAVTGFFSAPREGYLHWLQRPRAVGGPLGWRSVFVSGLSKEIVCCKQTEGSSDHVENG